MKRREFLKKSAKASLLLSLPIQQVLFDSTPALSGKRILFIGDSITQAGDYINFFECQLRISKPDISYEVYNLGLASETISGLSEEAHPFPRPYLHDRLDNILDGLQPEVLFACYGINCGIYHPFEERLFRKYQEGITKLIRTADARKIQLILLTPPPYAALVQNWNDARKDQNRTDYSYAKPYVAYDDVMRKYAEWIMGLKEVQRIDIQTPMRTFQEICYGQDMIHPNILGHQLMAHTILQNLQSERTSDKVIQLNWKKDKVEKEEGISKFRLDAPKNSHVVRSDSQEYNQMISSSHEFIFKVDQLPPAMYQLFDHNFYLGQYNQDELEKGVKFSPLSNSLKYENLSFVRKAQQLYELVASKREVCDYALLQYIGHQRPMTKEGLPIVLAERKRKEMNASINQLLEDRTWEVEMIKL
ncbi:SGNH/GDSL hydrolase family protein [Catalinimonas niigatensis]|uniref:SGNH/GDSL hydrolase family protein n=1 Tax=Catalinimonas niigatensis TaxID=1397264 RepID=UPI002666C25C|nr:SGNH/GDSL hydrolase family protein [Catalinimonas niigatensis]WPP51260.1 SGNH/GDSL hydrolase family protein [Catalinimonas niigatensis]